MIGIENVFFKSLHQFRKLIDNTDPLDLKLPRICLMGTPNSGKSILLESIIGLDIIPIEQKLQIKRPLELNLKHINSGEQYATFEEIPDKKIIDFSQISEIINKLQKENEKHRYITYAEISKPIILNIYSQKFPEVTFIDLPGTPYIPFGECPKNIISFPSKLASEYADDNSNLLICVIPVDNYNENFKLYSFRLIQNLGSQNFRIIGVLTKIDLIEESGEEAEQFKQIIMNKYNPLKFGYVGIKNRTSIDINNKITLEESIKREKIFFQEKTFFFGKLPKDKVGYEVFIEKLKKTYFEMIKENLPNELKILNDKLLKKEFIENGKKKAIPVLEFINENSYSENEAFNKSKQNEIRLNSKEDMNNFMDLINKLEYDV